VTRIVQVDPAHPLFDAVYADVLTPSFPPEERGGLEELRAGALAGTSSVFAALDTDEGEDERPAAAAVGDWSPETGVALLSYLAVRSGRRGTGVGGELLAAAMADWRERWRPALVLAEIEHPSAHAASEAYGDPDKRVRFYARRGMRVLDVPYFQPGLRPGSPRMYGFMLCALEVAAAGAGPGPDTVDGARVARFMTEYLQGCEGAVGTDPACLALFAALDRPEGVLLLDPAEYPRVAVSTPDGPARHV
jgi:GNAT superfamily N-acetyltransferase